MIKLLTVPAENSLGIVIDCIAFLSSQVLASLSNHALIHYNSYSEELYRYIWDVQGKYDYQQGKRKHRAGKRKVAWKVRRVREGRKGR